MATRKSITVEAHHLGDILFIRRGAQWRISITRAEALDLANTLVDHIEQDTQ